MSAFQTGLKIALIVCCGAPLLAQTGCSKAGSKASQVLVKVNDNEISVHQLNNQLAKLPANTLPADEVQKKLLEKLVDRELFVQQAEQEKLDRKPEVMMAIDEARLDILAQAYAQQKAASVTAQTDADATRFYNDNPNIFAQRKVYEVEELGVPGNMPQLAEFKLRMGRGDSLEATANWLKSVNVAASFKTEVLPAERIAPPILAKLVALQGAQIGIYETPQSVIALQIKASKAQPVDLATAKQQILALLTQQAAAKAVNDEVARLRALAKIKYVGEAKVAAPAPQAAPAPAATDTKDDIAHGAAGLK